MPRKVIIYIVLATFFSTFLSPLPESFAQTLIDLPSPGTMVNKSGFYQPLIFKGILVNVKNPLRFDFLVDKGDSGLSGEALKDEITHLAQYFLTCLAVPEDDLWVNLSPYEKDRIVPSQFGVTLMGKDLLEQDYLLKQIMASLSYPESALGSRFWQKVRSEALKLYGTTEIPMTAFNKVWIVPKSADVYVQGNSAFVVHSQLDVMLEQDYLALKKNTPTDLRHKAVSNQNVGASQAFHEVILPELEKEVNEGKNFAVVRQVYNAMILATWYKRHLSNSFLGRSYVGKNKVRGIDIADKGAKQKIFQQYLKAYKKCVYNYIKEDYDPLTQQTVARKYVSGGMYFAGFGRRGSVYQEKTSARGMMVSHDLAIATIDVRVRRFNQAMTSRTAWSLLRGALLSLIVMVGVGVSSAAYADVSRHILRLGNQITTADRPDIERLKGNSSPDDVDALYGRKNPITGKPYKVDTAFIREHWDEIFEKSQLDWKLQAVIVAFQHKNHLQEDGRVGDQTREALRGINEEASPEGQEGTEVARPTPKGQAIPNNGVSSASLHSTPQSSTFLTASGKQRGQDGGKEALPNPTVEQKIAPPTVETSAPSWTLNYNLPNVVMAQGGTNYINSQGSLVLNAPLSSHTTLSVGGLLEEAGGDWVNGGPTKSLYLANFGATGGITHDWGPLEATAGFTPHSIFARAKPNILKLSLGDDDRFTLGPPELFFYAGSGSVVGQLNLGAALQITRDIKAAVNFTGYHVPAHKGSLTQAAPDQWVPWVNVNLTYQHPTYKPLNLTLVAWHIPGINDYERFTSNFLVPNSPLAYSESLGAAHTFQAWDQTITWGPFIAWNLGFQGNPYGGLNFAVSGSAAGATSSGGSPPPPTDLTEKALVNAKSVKSSTTAAASIGVPNGLTSTSSHAASLSLGGNQPVASVAGRDNAQIAQNGGIDMNSRLMRLNIKDDVNNRIEITNNDFSQVTIVGAVPRVSGITPVTPQMLQNMLS